MVLKIMTEEDINSNLECLKYVTDKLFNNEKLNNKESLELILSYTIKSPTQIKALATSLLYKYKNLQSILVTPVKELICVDGLNGDTATSISIIKACALKMTWENLE